MPYCVQCGYKYNKGDKFCSGCGVGLEGEILFNERVERPQRHYKQDRAKRIWQGALLIGVIVLILVPLLSYDSTDLSFFTSHPNIPVRNLFGILGAYFSGFLFFFFGKTIYIVLISILFYTTYKFIGRTLPQFHARYIITTITLLIFALLLLLGIVNNDPLNVFNQSGLVGLCFPDFLTRYLGVAGAYIIILIIVAMSLLPYFVKKPVVKVAGNSILAIIVILILVSISIYKRDIDSHFMIKEIEIQIGNAEDAAKDIKLDYYIIHRKNIFDLDILKLHEKIIKSNPQLSDVSITKHFPNKILINVEPRQSVAQIKIGDFVFSVDGEGMVLKQQNSMERNLPLISLDRAKTQPKLGEVYDHDEFKSALALLNVINRYDELKQAVTEIGAYKRYDFWFDLNGVEIRVGDGNYPKKLYLLNKLILPRFKGEFDKIEYIDLRFKDYVISYKR